jgi:DNA-binding CsgD family transcriptional regulator
MLIAGGKRDKEIAAALIISPATVARHSANLRVKLGVRTRAQVAAWIAKNAVSAARR